MSFMSSYAKITAGLCPAEGKIIQETVKLKSGMAEIDVELNESLVTLRNMDELLSLPLPPPPEGSEIDPVLEEKREELKHALVPAEREIRQHLQDVSDLEDSFGDALSKSRSERFLHLGELRDNVEEIMVRMPAMKNLSAETIKDIKNIVLKSPAEIQTALEKLDPSNTAGLKDIVNAILAELKTHKKEIAQRDTKISQSDMTLFANTSQRMQTLEKAVTNMHTTLKDFAKNLEVVSRAADLRVQKGAQALREKLDKPLKTVTQRVAPAA